jgi:lipopolysaccharide/colanic/teichoic acid biosynthesis glycosyltransferase
MVTDGEPAARDHAVEPRTPTRRELSKRLFDIAFSLLALAASGPVIALSALLVKLSSPGPMFYRSRRAGRYGEPFELIKLRTMRDAASAPGLRITGVADQRVTRVGWWLRTLKIDELPQFWNVLRGDMSIVGPRPEDWDIVQEHYSDLQRRVLDMRPGLTTPAQVEWYPDFAFHDPPPPGASVEQHYLKRHLPLKLALEQTYLENQSFLLDLEVIARTFYCMTVRSWLIPPRKKPLPIVTSPGATLGGER